MNPELMGKTLHQVISNGENYLKECGVYEYKSDAWLLAEHVFRIRRIDYLIDPNQAADPQKAGLYGEMILKRGTHYPLQYITGCQHFYGLDLIVNEHVLIPRLDTEVLTETVLEYCHDEMEVLDMCTGSGCIILSVAANKRLTRAVGADWSKEALEVARQNGMNTGAASVEFVHSDLFESVDGVYDIIISNPPYIPTEEIGRLMNEVKSHEPFMALDGSADGLKYYRLIAASAGCYLKKNGMIFFEIGWDQAKAVTELLKDNGFSDVIVKKDLAGLDRVVYAIKES